MMERLLADAADHVQVDRFHALGGLRESRLDGSAAQGGQRNGGGQEILLQDGSPGWFDSPSLSDGKRLLPDLWSWSIELDPFRAKPRVRFACPGYGLRAASWWRAAQHRQNRPSPRWTRSEEHTTETQSLIHNSYRV